MNEKTLKKYFIIVLIAGLIGIAIIMFFLAYCHKNVSTQEKPEKTITEKEAITIARECIEQYTSSSSDENPTALKTRDKSMWIVCNHLLASHGAYYDNTFICIDTYTGKIVRIYSNSIIFVPNCPYEIDHTDANMDSLLLLSSHPTNQITKIEAISLGTKCLKQYMYTQSGDTEYRVTTGAEAIKESESGFLIRYKIDAVSRAKMRAYSKNVYISITHTGEITCIYCNGIKIKEDCPFAINASETDVNNML